MDDVIEVSHNQNAILYIIFIVWQSTVVIGLSWCVLKLLSLIANF